MTVLHWFRDDLRLIDNPALYHASQQGSCLYLYILDEAEHPGRAAKAWLYHALADLDAQLEGHLLFFRGRPEDILPELMQEIKADLLTMTRRYHASGARTDANISSLLASQNIKTAIISGNLLWEPEEISKPDGTPYKVFTPFYRRGCLNAAPPRQPLGKPVLNHARKLANGAISLDELGLLSGRAWENTITQKWDISAKGAKDRLDAFTNAGDRTGLNDYVEGRNFPAKSNVSRLSPYLRFGQISAHQAWHQAAENRNSQDKQLDIFRSELGWREFSYSLLHFNPELKTTPLQPRFAHFGWIENAAHLKAWRRGQTGYPIIDAGMRELYQTGYMHNGVRMIVGSFLVKNLLLHWHHGEAWFWDCLFDADPANNSASWQWIAGCGADAAPYFRVFNPVTQGQKFDAEGRYTRHYVPEVADMPDKYLFNPWEAPADVRAAANLRLGQNYPEPIVDIKTSRQRALDSFAQMPKASQ